MSDEIKALRAELADLAGTMKQQQIDFAQGLIDGKTQEQAYTDAGLKGKNPNSDSSNYLNRNASICKYFELTKKILALEVLPAQVATFEQKRKMLWEIASRSSMLKVTLKDGTAVGGIISTEDDPLEIFDATAAKTAVSAIAELNKMDGDLAAIKTEGKTTVTYENLPESELDARLNELRRKAGIARA